MEETSLIQDDNIVIFYANETRRKKCDSDQTWCMQRKTKPTSGGGGDTLDEIREALVDPSEVMETQVSGDGSHVSSKEGRNSSLAGDFVDVDASETGIGA